VVDDEVDKPGRQSTMAQRLNAAARDAAISRIRLITAGVVALGLAGTAGLGVAIASAIPVKTTPPKTAPVKTGAAVPAPKPQAGVVPKPQVATQEPDTTSGGS
jgi:hypothetical protein